MEFSWDSARIFCKIPTIKQLGQHSIINMTIQVAGFTVSGVGLDKCSTSDNNLFMQINGLDSLQEGFWFNSYVAFLHSKNRNIRLIGESQLQLCKCV